MLRSLCSLAFVALLGAALSACRSPAMVACEDFVEKVEECVGATHPVYNEGYCDDNVDSGCDDRRYYDCLRDNMTCINGNVDTTPIICQLESDVACPG